MLKQDLIIGFMFSPPNGPNQCDVICAVAPSPTPPPFFHHLLSPHPHPPPSHRVPLGHLRKGREADQSDKEEGFMCRCGSYRDRAELVQTAPEDRDEKPGAASSSLSTNPNISHIHGHDLRRCEGGKHQHLHCIKPKTRLIGNFTSQMVALIRRGRGGGSWGSHGIMQ